MDIQIFEEQSSKEKLMRYVEAYNPGHDNTQIQHFIIDRNGVTDYGKYKQCLAEIHTNYTALQAAYIKRKKLHAYIDIYEERKKNATPAESALFDIKIEEKNIALANMEKAILRNIRELKVIFRLCLEYEKSIEGKDVQQLESEFWTTKLSRDIEIQKVFHGGNLSGVMETALSLPLDMQSTIETTINNRKQLYGE